MQRLISEYRQDEENQWVAVLNCGHGQHVRHHPPLKTRPWVKTEAGRQSHLGTPLNCLRCDRRELPPDFVAYKKTPVFTETSLPTALRRDHFTSPGVWARIHVLKGRLRYQIPALSFDAVLTPAQEGIVVAEVPHSVEPLGPVEFFLEFFKEPA